MKNNRITQTGFVLLLLILFAGCSEGVEPVEPTDNQDNMEVTKRSSQGSCETDAPCGNDGYCKYGTCWRKTGNSTIVCNDFGAPPGYACEIKDNISASAFQKECETDSDCSASRFGPLCSKNLCSRYPECENEEGCLDDESCHPLGVCFLNQ